jgi:hypothetical protein
MSAGAARVEIAVEVDLGAAGGVDRIGGGAE